MRGFNIFSNGICPKDNVMTLVEFILTGNSLASSLPIMLQEIRTAILLFSLNCFIVNSMVLLNTIINILNQLNNFKRASLLIILILQLFKISLIIIIDYQLV